jgi:O-antigen/teichoic acid export membrane protein
MPRLFNRNGRNRQHFATDEIKKDLGGRAVRGGAVMVTAQGLKLVIMTASTLVLARLLTPHDYGLVGMVVVVTGFIALFKNLGLSTAMIQKAELTHEQTSTLFWVNLLASVAITLITIALAPAVAWFYAEPQLTKITAAFALGFIISGLGSNHEALIRRQMRFATLASVEIASQAIGILVAIFLAFRGAGVWALVFNQLAYFTAYTIGLWLFCNWIPGPPVRYSGVRPMLAFGRDLTGYNVLNYFTRNLDNLLVGKFWGAQQLGIYSKAYQLLLLPVEQLGVPLDGIALTTLSRLNDSATRYRQGFLRMLDKVAMFSMPLIAFMMVTSDWLVRIVLGPQWSEAAAIFAVLGLVGLLEPVGNAMGWLMISQGRSRDVLRWGMVNSSITVASFLIGLPWGAFGVAVAFSLIGTFVRFPLLFWFTTRVGPVRMSDIYKAMVVPLLAASGVLGTIYGFRHVVALSPLAGVASSAVIALLATAIVFLVTPKGRTGISDLRLILRQLIGRQTQDQLC